CLQRRSHRRGGHRRHPAVILPEHVDHDPGGRHGIRGEQRGPEHQLDPAYDSLDFHFCTFFPPTSESAISFTTSAPCRGTAASKTKLLKSCPGSREQIPPLAHCDTITALSAPHSMPSSQAATCHATSASRVPATWPSKARSPLAWMP